METQKLKTKILFFTLFVALFQCAPQDITQSLNENNILFEFLINKKSKKKKDTSTNNPFKPISKNIQGKAEKGPLLSNSQVTIFELDENLDKTGILHKTQVQQEGLFSYKGTFQTKKILIEIKGKYFNEVNGKNTNQPITLTAIADISQQKEIIINVNTLTALQTERQKTLVKGGYDFKEATKISKKEVLAVFGLKSEEVPKKLSELEIAKDPQLLRVSAILQGKKEDSEEVQKFIEKIQKEISDNGKLKEPSSIKKLQDQEKEVKDEYKKIGENLKKEFPAYKEKMKDKDIEKIKKTQVNSEGGSTSLGKVPPKKTPKQEGEEEKESEKEKEPTEQEKINQFTADDIQLWDNINPDKNSFPSGLDFGSLTFTVPNKYKGLTNFKVQISGSIEKNDVTGTVQYKVKVSNSNNSLSRLITIQYTGLKTRTITDILNSWTEDDMKLWDGVNETSSVFPSEVSNPTFNIPNQYKGLVRFSVALDGDVKKTDPIGKVQYNAIVTKSLSNKTFTVTYNGFNKSQIPVTHFSKMEDSSGKAYGRSVLRIDTSETLISHNTRGTCSTTTNTLLISSDNFTNCDAVYVKKGQNTNHIVIPKETWALDTTYSIGFRGAYGKVKKFTISDSLVSFTTNNLNHDTSGSAGTIAGSVHVGSVDKLHQSKVFLENDGEGWFYYNYGRTEVLYDSNRCFNLVNYEVLSGSTGGNNMRNMDGRGAVDRQMAKNAITVLDRDVLFIVPTGWPPPPTAYVRLSDPIAAREIWNSIKRWHRFDDLRVFQFCWFKVPDRS